MAEPRWINAGKKLRELRKETGLSLFKVSKKLHISGNYLSLLERGKQSPSNTVLYNIAEFYNVPSQELFDLYEKIDPNEANNIINAPPSLRKVLTQLSVDKKLSDDEKERLSKVVSELINEALDEKED